MQSKFGMVMPQNARDRFTKNGSVDVNAFKQALKTCYFKAVLMSVWIIFFSQGLCYQPCGFYSSGFNDVAH